MAINRATILEEDGCRIRVVHVDRVTKARKEAMSEGEIHRLSLSYRLLGDPTRLKMVMALRDNEMCVCDLAAFLQLTESAISHQLRRLKDSALVRSRRDGQVLYYSLDDEHVSQLLNVGLEHLRE